MNEAEKVVKRFSDLSLKYHQLSLLFHELSQSIRFELHKKPINPNSKKQVHEYLTSLNLDFEAVETILKTPLTLRKKNV